MVREKYIGGLEKPDCTWAFIPRNGYSKGSYIDSALYNCTFALFDFDTEVLCLFRDAAMQLCWKWYG